MTHREDFSMKTVTFEPGQGRLSMCDVCAEYINNEAPRVMTFVGTTPQSDVCMDCVTKMTNIGNAMRTAKARAARIPSDGELRVETAV